MDLYFGVFLPRHWVGNRGRETELFIRVSPGHQPSNKSFVYRRNLDWMRFWLNSEDGCLGTISRQWVITAARLVRFPFGSPSFHQHSQTAPNT
jgi:hypothetical protein